jgi:hypothetical protein
VNHLNTAGGVLLIVGTVFLVLATIPSYRILATWRRVAWRRSELGIVLHDKNRALAVILTLQLFGVGLLLLGAGRPLWFEIARLVALAWVARTLWRQDAAYRRILAEADLEDNGAGAHVARE